MFYSFFRNESSLFWAKKDIMKVCKLILNSVSTRMRRQPEINGRNEFSSWTTFLQEKKKHLFQGFPVCGKSTCFDRHRYSGLGRTGKVSHHQNQVLANSRVNLKGSLDGNDLHSLPGNRSFLRMKKHCFCALQIATFHTTPWIFQQQNLDQISASKL